MRRFLLGAVLVVCGCEEGSGEDNGEGSTGAAEGGSSGEGGVDAAMVQAMADGYSGFEKINADAVSSAHGNAAMVNWYVPSDIAAMFRTIDPDAPAEISFSEGALIVKEHLDGDGAADGYTMMYKGPPGTNAEANDWWFGRVDGAGELRDQGAVGFCMNCHSSVATSDWLYGVPADNQS